MQILRTANAGVRIRLDGIELLLDGVCKAAEGYLGTPESIRRMLTEQAPDLVAFTHKHPDHWDGEYAAEYRMATGHPVLEPGSEQKVCVGGVEVVAVPSRHIGPQYKDVPHVSFLIRGSKTVWFLGDAAPTQWHGKPLQPLDVVIAPYAYASTPLAWSTLQGFGAKHVVLVHLPDKQNDPHGLWPAVKSNISGKEVSVHIPEIGEVVFIS